MSGVQEEVILTGSGDVTGTSGQVSPSLPGLKADPH